MATAMLSFGIIVAFLVTVANCKGLGRCGLPPETGPCRAYMEKFFYNSTSQACEMFVYGGCDGNANRFTSYQECRRSCVCNQKPDRGQCRAYVPSYFYNSASGKCETFVYGGCGGNANRFETLDECTKGCVCIQPADPGFCLALIPAFYYNYEAQKCNFFYFGGCHSNGNHFKTVAECKGACGLY